MAKKKKKISKKNPDLDAIQWDGEQETLDEIEEILVDIIMAATGNDLVLSLDEGDGTIQINDWIIIDEIGDVKILSDEKFNKKYKIK